MVRSRFLLEIVKLAALSAGIALVIWGMPEYQGLPPKPANSLEQVPSR